MKNNDRKALIAGKRLLFSVFAKKCGCRDKKRPISAEITGAGAYGGLKGAIGSSPVINTTFTELIEKIEEEFDPDYGIPDFIRIPW